MHNEQGWGDVVLLEGEFMVLPKCKCVWKRNNNERIAVDKTLMQQTREISASGEIKTKECVNAILKTHEGRTAGATLYISSPDLDLNSAHTTDYVQREHPRRSQAAK